MVLKPGESQIPGLRLGSRAGDILYVGLESLWLSWKRPGPPEHRRRYYFGNRLASGLPSSSPQYLIRSNLLSCSSLSSATSMPLPPACLLGGSKTVKS